MRLSRQEVVLLYTRLLEAWNARDPVAFAELFAEDGSAVGYDGSQMNGRTEIAASLAPIFAHHPTAAYVARLRDVRPLGDDVVLLRAVAGMVPPGKTELSPARNAIQSLVAVIDGGVAAIAHFQNTPAAFDGRPELAEALTQELTESLQTGRVVSED
jgi:uncharacterized protein (TIGR02246 family)